VEAQPHGRADFLLLIIRTVLVIILDIFPAFFSPWVNVAFCAVSGVFWIVSAVNLLPFYDATMNRLNIAYALIFLWSVCCLILSLTRADIDVGVQLFMAMPLAGLAGLFLHDMKVMRLMRSKLDRLSSPYDVEIKVRFMVHETLYGHATDRLYSLLDSEIPEREREPLVAGASSPRRESLMKSSSFSPRAGLSRISASTNADAGQAAAGFESEYREGVGKVSGADVEEDEASEFEARVRAVFPRERIDDILYLFKAAVQKFRSSSILHVFFPGSIYP